LKDIESCEYSKKKEPLKKKQDWEIFCRVICPLSILEEIAGNPKCNASSLTEQDVELILQSILKRYTVGLLVNFLNHDQMLFSYMCYKKKESDIQSIVKKMSKEADFEEQRIFIRITPVLFEHLVKLNGINFLKKLFLCVLGKNFKAVDKSRGHN
jgi:hypothetical protein